MDLCYVMSVESVMMNIKEFLWSMSEDLFKIDERVMMDGEIYDIYISLNLFFGVVFRDDMGYPVYNKELTIRGGF